MAKRGIETAVVRRAAAASEDEEFYGEPSASPEAGVAVLDSCLVWPRASEATSGRGVTTIEGLHIFVPWDGVTWAPGIPEEARELHPDDMVLVRDEEWRMDGAVGDWRKKSGDQIGYLFEVRRWSA